MHANRLLEEFYCIIPRTLQPFLYRKCLSWKGNLVN